jgi:hypothetical protein
MLTHNLDAPIDKKSMESHPSSLLFKTAMKEHDRISTDRISTTSQKRLDLKGNPDPGIGKIKLRLLSVHQAASPCTAIPMNVHEKHPVTYIFMLPREHWPEQLVRKMRLEAGKVQRRDEDSLFGP